MRVLLLDCLFVLFSGTRRWWESYTKVSVERFRRWWHLWQSYYYCTKLGGKDKWWVVLFCIICHTDVYDSNSLEIMFRSMLFSWNESGLLLFVVLKLSFYFHGLTRFLFRWRKETNVKEGWWWRIFAFGGQFVFWRFQLEFTDPMLTPGSGTVICVKYFNLFYLFQTQAWRKRCITSLRNMDPSSTYA